MIKLAVPTPREGVVPARAYTVLGCPLCAAVGSVDAFG